jgi:hypothetical protein
MFVAEGVGSCSTMETKYRYRKAEQKCPGCGKDTIIKGKKEYGGGWLCWGKKGGCGAKFKDGDPKIENQDMGRIEFDNPADYYNTVLKIAKKRAHVDATLTATAASDIFTQDLEDMPAEALGNDKEPAGKSTKKAPGKKKADPKKTAPKNGNCTKKQYDKLFAIAKKHWPDENQEFKENSVKSLCEWFRAGERLTAPEADQIILFFHILVPVAQTWQELNAELAIGMCKTLIDFYKKDPGQVVSEEDMLGIANNWDDFVSQYQFEQEEGEDGDKDPNDQASFKEPA